MLDEGYNFSFQDINGGLDFTSFSLSHTQRPFIRKAKLGRARQLRKEKNMIERGGKAAKAIN